MTGPVAPGQLITLYGRGLGPDAPISGFAPGELTLPRSLGGVTVTFDDIQAPLLYVSTGQVNVQIPFEIRNSKSTLMTIFANGAPIASRVFGVTQRNPGVFVSVGGETCGSAGPALMAVALNEDGTLNSCENPGAAGSEITLLLTGTGTAARNQVTGSLSTDPGYLSSPVAVVSGLLPLSTEAGSDQQGAVSGLGQVRVRVPETIDSLGALHVSVSLDGAVAGPFSFGGLGAPPVSLGASVFVKPSGK